MSGEYGIEPMLAVQGGAKAVEFYQAAFGAEVVYRIEDPDGNVVARLSVGGARFWVNDDPKSHPGRLGGSTFRTILIVPDPDAMHARAVAAGGRDLSGGVSDAHGWRTGRIEDPFGHGWEISKPLQPR